MLLQGVVELEPPRTLGASEGLLGGVLGGLVVVELLSEREGFVGAQLAAEGASLALLEVVPHAGELPESLATVRATKAIVGLQESGALEMGDFGAA